MALICKLRQPHDVYYFDKYIVSLILYSECHKNEGLTFSVNYHSNQ